uniref:Pyr_redox domain-containing protein n=1 Tax=Gongylonema pulchrum TaxID=637853 RepID=A0A183EQG8_9BILA
LPVLQVLVELGMNLFEVRINYLYSKKFSKEDIFKIVKNSRFWLNTDVKTIDARLGWLQKTFELTGDEVRQVIVKEPRVIMFGVGPFEVWHTKAI